MQSYDLNNLNKGRFHGLDKCIKVTHEQVVESFENEINHPDGPLHQYFMLNDFVAANAEASVGKNQQLGGYILGCHYKTKWHAESEGFL